MIPGFIITLLTFPGVIIHELAHQIFCRLMGVPVFEVKYFQTTNPSGYVLHEKVENPFKNLTISFGPFIVNTIIGMLIVFPASIEILKFDVWDNIFNVALMWLGISILMHAFPSTGDAQVLVDSILKNKDVNFLVKVLVAPFVLFIYIGAIGSIVWLDLFYAITMAMFLPNIIISFI